MSVRENIAANIIVTLEDMTSPITLKKVTREPFEFDKLSNAQFPAVWIQSGDETREDTTIEGANTKRRGVISYQLVGFVKGKVANHTDEGSIDTARNELIEAIEEALDVDRTRGGNALDTQITDIGTDEGSLDPIGGITVTVRVIYDYTRGVT